MTVFCVVLPALGCVWCRNSSNFAGTAVCTSYAMAWRELRRVLTWETERGAQLFADMNGGTVKPLSEVFDHTVILAPLETHSPTESTP